MGGNDLSLCSVVSLLLIQLLVLSGPLDFKHGVLVFVIHHRKGNQAIVLQPQLGRRVPVPDLELLPPYSGVVVILERAIGEYCAFGDCSRLRGRDRRGQSVGVSLGQNIEELGGDVGEWLKGVDKEVDGMDAVLEAHRDVGVTDLLRLL